MKTAAASLVICLALATGCGATQWPETASSPTTAAPKVPDGWVAYRDPSGVTLQHPPEWKTQPSNLGPAFVYIDPSADAGGFRRNVNIVSQQLPAGMNEASYLRLSLAQITTLHGTLDHERDTILSGLAAHEVTWHFSKNGLTIDFLSVWTIRGRTAYIVTYSADDTGFAGPLPDVNRLIASVRLTPG